MGSIPVDKLPNLTTREIVIYTATEVNHHSDEINEIKQNLRAQKEEYDGLKKVVGNLDCEPKMNPGGSTAPCSASPKVHVRRATKELLLAGVAWAKMNKKKTTGIGGTLTALFLLWAKLGFPGVN